jgi:hypothetical protein
MLAHITRVTTWTWPLSLFLAIACADPSGPDASKVESLPPEQPLMVGVALEISASQIRIGEVVILRAQKVMSNGSRIQIPNGPSFTGDRPPEFLSTRSSVVAVNPVTGNAVGVSAGSTEVRVTYGGFTARGVISVREPVVFGSTALTINDFTLQEIDGPGSGYYAPQVRVSAPPGRALTVLVVSFSIPGIGAFPPWSCGGAIVGSEPQELNGEVYGSWTLEMSGTGVVTGDPTVTVTFLDDTGIAGVASLQGRIVQGSFPLTFTGGENGGPCYHGYRPPG